jgi:hypothetical protein
MIRNTLAINFCVKTPVCIETKSGIFGCASLMVKELAKFSHEINHIRLSLDSTGEMRIELLNNGFSHSAVRYRYVCYFCGGGGTVQNPCYCADPLLPQLGSLKIY